MAKKITADITTDGITIEMDGYPGETCKGDYEATIRKLEQEFGIKISLKSEKRKAGITTSTANRVSN